MIYENHIKLLCLDIIHYSFTYNTLPFKLQILSYHFFIPSQFSWPLYLGLDITQSLEILQILHGLTLSGRLVIATIHEPRFEIFHLFDSILFLCNGQV